MAKIRYAYQSFNDTAAAVIRQAEAFCQQYADDGYELTLRQLYYRFIATNTFPDSRTDPASGTKNTERNYKWLGDLVSKARVGGLIDWDHISDRGRESKGGDAGWRSPEAAMRSITRAYGITHWDGQPEYIECLPPGQVIITSEGVKPIIKVEAGDLVLTGKGRFRPVTKVLAHEYDGPMMTIRAAGLLPFRVTANHPVWTAHCDTARPGYKGATRKFSAWEFGRADNLRPFDLLAVPVLSETRPVGPVTMRTSGGRARVITVPWDSSLQAVIGLYLAEGCIRQDSRTVQFTIGMHEPEHWAALTRWAESAGITASTAVDGGARQVYLYSASLAAWLRSQFDCGARNKRIPRWLLEAPGNEQMEIIRWYYRGDGTIDYSTGNTLVASTRSLHLAQQVALILIRNSYLPSMHSTQDHGEPQYRIAVSGQSGVNLMRLWGHEPQSQVWHYNHLRAVDGYMATPVRKITSEHYSGLVYNLEVEEDHTFCASSVTHNCWVEKDALSQVIEQVASRWDVLSFACKGSPSTSAMHEAALRLRQYERDGRKTTVIYLGDHDPTGIDISRDVQDRLALFRSTARVDRIALNMDQITDNLPPSPVKVTDSRANGYIDTFGTDECWELDALEPQALDAMIEAAILEHLDVSLRQARLDQEERERTVLTAIQDNFALVRDYLVRENLLDDGSRDDNEEDDDDDYR